MAKLTCRFCDAPLRETFCDLGMAPLSNTYLEAEQLRDAEPYYPLCVYVCGECFLVQLPEYESPGNIFSEYAYFSSFSETWLNHAREYAESMIQRLGLHGGSVVVEIASNDGYLLKHFVARKIPVLGVEPAANVAMAARREGVPTIVEFFGRATARQLAEEGWSADLLLGNNVLAHVPDINDFVAGLRTLVKPGGVITMEFPHLARLMEDGLFDTIYHEHFSYLSLSTVERIFRTYGLVLFDVEELPTHGGSIRIFARHDDAPGPPVSERVRAMRGYEAAEGLLSMPAYRHFDEAAREKKRDIVEFLVDAKRRGKAICGYGAPAKGNTLLNYCGIGSDFIDFTVDRNPYKRDKYLPGSHIPVLDPEMITRRRPDYVFILSWNLKDEIMEQMRCIRDWGGKFVVPMPMVQVL